MHQQGLSAASQLQAGSDASEGTLQGPAACWQMDLTDAVHAPEEEALGDRGAEPKSRCHDAPQQASSCCDVYPVAVMPCIAMDAGYIALEAASQSHHQPGMQCVCPAPLRRPVWQVMYLLYPQEAMRMPVPVLWTA